jgi:uncharacterized membrane protein YukC
MNYTKIKVNNINIFVKNNSTNKSWKQYKKIIYVEKKGDCIFKIFLILFDLVLLLLFLLFVNLISKKNNEQLKNNKNVFYF